MFLIVIIVNTYSFKLRVQKKRSVVVMVKRERYLSEEVKAELYAENKEKDNKEAERIFLRDKNLIGVTESTIEKYLITFHVIERDLKILKIDKTLVNLNTTDIEDLILYWKKQVAIPTINGRLRVINPFFNVLYERGFIEYNPSASIKNVKEREIIKDTLEDDEIKRIVVHFKQTKTFSSFRNLAMFYLLLDTGIRIGECINIKIDDITANSIVIRLTKNGKERFVYPSDKCWLVLNKYIKVRGNLDTDVLFVNMDDLPLKRRYMQNILSKAALSCGIDKKVGPHMLRRTYAKNSIIGGVDVFSLSRLMGHSTLEMTKKYAQIWGTDLQKISVKTKDISNLFR